MCIAALRFLFYALNRLNELPGVSFEFFSNLISQLNSGVL